MEILSKEEKEEFLKSSRCLQLKEDFQFLSLFNSFTNHKQKPFRKIVVNNFKL